MRPLSKPRTFVFCEKKKQKGLYLYFKIQNINVMTVLEKKRDILMRKIMNADERLIERMLSISEEKPSFMCSLEELQESLIQQEDDLKAGKIQLIPHEQMKRKTYYEC